MGKIAFVFPGQGASVFVRAVEIPFQKSEVKSIMRKVADWQIANPHPAPEHDDLNWPQGALYVGMVDWAELAEKEDGDDRSEERRVGK